MSLPSWVPDWVNPSTLGTAGTISAVLGAVIAAIRSDPRKVVWFVIICGVGFMAVASGRPGAISAELVAAVWAATGLTDVYKTRQSGSVHPLVKDAYATTVPWLFSVVVVSSIGALVAVLDRDRALDFHSVVATGLATLTLVLWMLTVATASQAKALLPIVLTRDVRIVPSRTGFMLEGIKIPPTWYASGPSPVQVTAWGVLLITAVALLSPSYARQGEQNRQRVADALGLGSKVTVGDPSTGPSTGESTDRAPQLTPTPTGPPQVQDCDTTLSELQMRREGITDADVIARVLDARDEFSLPSIGCDVDAVAVRLDTTFVVFGGTGASDAIIVDDGTAAGAALNEAATFLIANEVDAEGALTGLSTSRRAGVGVWHRETTADGRCNLLEVPDDRDTAYRLSADQTVAVVRDAKKFDAFPVVSTSARDELLVRYFVASETSTNGFDVRATVTYTPLIVADLVGNGPYPCRDIERYLISAGAELDASAR